MWLALYMSFSPLSTKYRFLQILRFWQHFIKYPDTSVRAGSANPAPAAFGTVPAANARLVRGLASSLSLLVNPCVPCPPLVLRGV